MFLSGLNILLFGMNCFWMWIINVPYICLLVRLMLSEEGQCINIIHSFHLVKCVYRVHRIYVSTCDIVLYSKWIKMIPKYTGRRNLKTSIPLQTALQNSNILNNKTRMVYTGFVVYTKNCETLICVIFLAINIKNKYTKFIKLIIIINIAASSNIGVQAL